MAINFKSASGWLLCLTLMGGCVSIKLDTPRATRNPKGSEETQKQILNLALRNGSDIQIKDVAYVRFLTRYTPSKSNESPQYSCNDFGNRYSDRDYEAILFSSVSNHHEGDPQSIPIVSYQQAKNCQFLPMEEKYISQYFKLDSGADNSIALSLQYSQREKNSPNLNQILKDAATVSAALSTAGLAAIAPITKVLTTQATKDAVSRINNYISESKPVSITDRSAGSYVIAEIAGAGDIKVDQIDIELQHILTKTFEKPQPQPIGTFHILPMIQSTLLFDTNNSEIPIIGNNDEYKNLLKSKKFNDKSLLFALVGEDDEKRDVIKVKPNKDDDEYQKFQTACNTLDGLAKEIGLNIYDRAGLLYLLLSDFQLSTDRNWREFNESIGDETPITINDLEKYRDNNFDKCLDGYYLALKKMLPKQKISKKEISELIEGIKANENNASKGQITRTGKNFIKLVADSINPQFIPKLLKNLIPDNGWGLIYDNNNLFEDEKFLQILGLIPKNQGKEEAERTLRSFRGDHDALAKLLKSIPMKINPDCHTVSMDSSSTPKANGISYWFTTPRLEEPTNPYNGVLELSMDSTGTKLSSIAFNGTSQDFIDRISDIPFCDSSTEKSAQS